VSEYGLWVLSGETLDSGCWLAEYDPDAEDGAGRIMGTLDPSAALRFPDLGAALEEWKRPSTTHPLRRDGKPNRPLSAFTVQPRRLPHD
jgi:hypothetical protein